jgi:CheY-like chemotaxis protein
MAAAALAAPPLTVLLVEDDAADAVLVEEFFDSHAYPANLYRVSDGVEALRYLTGEGQFAGEPIPDLILLDLNMPRMGGRELLRTLKASDSPWLTIPVIVLTTSSAEDDVAGSYRDHANAYVTKALNYDAFQTSMAELHTFFARVATLYRPNDQH